MKAITPTFLCLTALATQAHASSPDAWAAYDKAVLASCTKTSGLKKTSNPSATPRSSMTESVIPRSCCKASTRKKTHERPARHRAVPLQQEKQNRLRDRVGLHPPNSKSAVNGA